MRPLALSLLAVAAAAGPDAGGDFLPAVAPARSRRFDLTDYGAVGDGETDCTRAFEAAVADIAAHGDGELYVPEGAFLTAPFNFTSHMTLLLERGASLEGAPKAEWGLIPPLPSYGQGRDHPGWRYTSLLHGEHLSDVAVLGAGAAEDSVVDGNGAEWWLDHQMKRENYTRGHLLEFMYSSEVLLANVTFRNSPFWALHPYVVDRLTASRIVIDNPLTAPNTDCFDPDSSSNVRIEHSALQGGDDGIAIKSGWECYGYDYGVPTVNVSIHNVTITGNGACAGVCIGSEMSGGVANVAVTDSTFVGVGFGLRVKTGLGKGGYVRDVTLDGVELQRYSQFAFQIDEYYGSHNPLCELNDSYVPDVGGFALRNVTGGGLLYAAQFKGLPEAPIYDVELADIDLAVPLGYECSNVSGTYRSVEPAPCSSFSPSASRSASASP